MYIQYCCFSCLGGWWQYGKGDYGWAMCVKWFLVNWQLSLNANLGATQKSFWWEICSFLPFSGSPTQQPVCPNLLDRHRLGEVPGLVDVATPEHGHVVAEQLHGDDGEDGLQRVHRLGHLILKWYVSKMMILSVCNANAYLDVLSVLGNVRDGLLVALLANQDGLALARLDLLEGIQALLINAVPNHHLWKRSIIYS